MAHDLCERRHSADVEASVALADPLQFRDAAEIHNIARTLDAILQPVEAVEAACEDPSVGAIAVEQAQGVRRGRGLKQFEGWHYISNNRHNSPRTIRTARTI
jgi:hypothetical protein